MAITVFALNVGNNIYRAGEVWVSANVGTNWYRLGQVKEVKVSATPITTDADSVGRNKQLGMNISMSGVVQQTSDTELAALVDLTSSFLWVHITDAGGELVGILPDPSAFGVTFKQVALNVGAELDFGGGESGLPISFAGTCSMTQWASLGSATRDITLGT